MDAIARACGLGFRVHLQPYVALQANCILATSDLQISLVRWLKEYGLATTSIRRNVVLLKQKQEATSRRYMVLYEYKDQGHLTLC